VITVTAGDEPQRQKVFAQQLIGVVRGLRPLIPLAYLLVVIAVALLWRDANHPLMTAGAATIVVTATFARLRLMRPWADLNAFARAHVGVAAAFGIGWAVFSTAILWSSDERLVTMILWIEMGLIASGLVMYMYLPVAFVVYAVPIAVPMTIMSAKFGVGGSMTAVPLTILYLVVLARCAVDQCRMFVEGEVTTARLIASEAAAALSTARRSGWRRSRCAAPMRCAASPSGRTRPPCRCRRSQPPQPSSAPPSPTFRARWMSMPRCARPRTRWRPRVRRRSGGCSTARRRSGT
jgi:hypothetical protein